MKNLFFLLVFICLNSFADNVEDLNLKLKKFTSFEATFTQSVYDEDNDLIQEGFGKLNFKKPNLFKWVYLEPHKNQIISDGDLVYIYDPDLSQVIISNINKVNTVTPATIFAQDNLNDFYTVQLIKINNQNWYRCKAKNLENNFQQIDIAFNKQDIIDEMKIIDGMKNLIKVKYSNVNLNRSIDDAYFLFNIPENTDVIKN
ncbi:MAG: outer membrane lipoprotein chaperone LolA [Nitrosomonadales bacterium]|jgi:outer membrane lipoprotein carrier protein